MKKVARKVLRITLIVLLVLIVLAAGALVTATYWFIPNVIRTEVRQQLGRQWDGRVEVRSADFWWSGRILVEGIDLFDANGRQWVHVGSVEVGIRDMVSMRPLAERVVTREVAAHWYMGPGERPPFKKAPPSSGGGDASRYLDLRDIRVEGASITVVGPQGQKLEWGGYELRAVPEANGFAVDLRQKAEAGSPSGGLAGPVVTGRIDTTGGPARLDVSFHDRLAAEETALLLAAAGQPGLSAAARLDANLVVEFPFYDPAAVHVTGQALCSEGRIADANGVLAEGLAVAADFGADYTMRAVLSQAAFMNGRAEGNVVLLMPPGRPWEYGGRLAVSKLDLARFPLGLGVRSKLPQGLLTGGVSFAGRLDSADSFRANAAGILEKSDLMNVPVLPDLVRALRVTDLGPLGDSSAAASFTMAGMKITIEEAHVANAVSALEAQKGGTIDIASRRLDLYVVGAPLRQIKPVLDLPIIAQLSGLEKNLTRLRVLGEWTDPAPKLIRAEPLGNLAEGTKEFFRSSAEAGGKLGEGILKGIGSLLPK